MKTPKTLLIFLLIAIVFCIIFVISTIFFLVYIYPEVKPPIDYPEAEAREILFKYSYESHGRYNISYGYYIYNTGEIEEYDDYDTDRFLIYDQLDEEEIQKLYELSTLVKDEFETDKNVPIHDIGISTTQIYNEELSKWVMLTSGGDSVGRNRTKISEEILDLIKEITKKYLDDEKYSI